MTRQPPSAYSLAMTVDREAQTIDLVIRVYGPDGDQVLSYGDEWHSWLWSWKDLALLVERQWALAGGLGSSMPQPSPFVDLS